MARPTLLSQQKVLICGLLLILLPILLPIGTFGRGQSHSAASSLQQPGDPQTLVRGVPVERELVSGQIHSYQISLAAGEYLGVVIDQRGITVAPKVFAPDKSLITDGLMTHAPKGPLSVSILATVTGTYLLEIQSLEEHSETGRYEVVVTEQRLATVEDKTRLAAERIFQEGEQLKRRPTLEERVLALTKFEEAAAIWRKIGDRKGEGKALASLGTGYELGGDLQTAFDYYQRAILLAQSAGNRPGEANLHLSIGRIQAFFGDKQAALDSFNRSAQLYKESAQRYGEALALSSIGTLYLSLGELPRALEYHERTLPTLSSVGAVGNLCTSFNALGNIYLGMGDNQKALEAYNQALVIARKIQDSNIETKTLSNLGNLQLSMGDKQKALDSYTQALKLAQVGGFQVQEAILHKSIGNVASLMGDSDKALDSLTQALNQSRSVGMRAEEANTLHLLARVNLSKGNLVEARKQIEMALDIKEFVRAPVVDRNLRLSSASSIQDSYSLYINVLMQSHKQDPLAGHDATALQASERARARGLLELLSESEAHIREGADPELLALERSLHRQLNAKAAARTRLSDKVQAASFDKDISQLTSRYLEVEAQIRATSPRYAALTQPQPLSASEIQQMLDEHSVLLEFSLGEERSWLWVVTPKTITSHPLPPRAEIESVSRRVYDLMTARQPKPGLTEAEQKARIIAADGRFQNEAVNLSQTLLGQIAGRLREELKGKRLLIVASGALEYLPFAALPIPSNENGSQPLIAEHEIVNLPSASVLSLIRRETAGRAPATKTVAVLADPVFDVNDPRLLAAKRKGRNQEIAINTRSAAEETSSSSDSSDDSPLTRAVRSLDRGNLSRLPFSREEADAIAQLVPGGSLLKATDFQATRAKAVSGDLTNYRIVHFATHGLLNSEHPELSGLVLSLVDENGKAQDGFLRMHEIYNLRLPAEVVVLSACQTGLGKEIKGEGLVGLTRGFMYAGAQRVVASLWQVDDLATAELMKRFYRGMLKDNLRPAAALRAAQLELMKQKRWSSPYFWSAFVIQGEWK